MKKPDMKKLHIPKIEGITLRWLINIIGVIAVFFVVVFIVSASSMKSHYYSNVESILNSGASISAVNYFSSNLEAGNSIEQSAEEYIDSFSYKDKTTTWIIDSDGNIIVSSNGFAIANQEMPDFDEAVANSDKAGKFVGRLNSGEKVMAICRVIKNQNGDIVGAVRVMSSLKQVDNQIRNIVFLIFLGLLTVFAIILFSNLFFIRSIIIPVQEITDITEKISKTLQNSTIFVKFLF